MRQADRSAQRAAACGALPAHALSGAARVHPHGRSLTADPVCVSHLLVCPAGPRSTDRRILRDEKLTTEPVGLLLVLTTGSAATLGRDQHLGELMFAEDVRHFVRDAACASGQGVKVVVYDEPSGANRDERRREHVLAGPVNPLDNRGVAGGDQRADRVDRYAVGLGKVAGIKRVVRVQANLATDLEGQSLGVCFESVPHCQPLLRSAWN